MTIDVLDMVPEEGLEPSQPRGPRDFESRASTSSATPAGWHSRLRPRATARLAEASAKAGIADARNAV